MDYSQDQKRIDYQTIFSGDTGRRVLFDLMDFCGLLKPAVGNTGEEWMRNVILYIMANMMPQPEDRAKFIREEYLNG